ncbi:MAG: pre-mRNA-splicing factor [bacterium]|nr:pre-mRNA-splicing factor [bacterium]
MAAGVYKGKILTLEGSDRNKDPDKAKVQANTQDGAVSMSITIPWYLRGKMGDLKKQTEVAFVLFEDGSGIVLSRMDGEWKGIVPGDVEIKDGGLKVGKGAEIKDDIKTTKVRSYNYHVHGGVGRGNEETDEPERN